MNENEKPPISDAEFLESLERMERDRTNPRGNLLDAITGMAVVATDAEAAKAGDAISFDEFEIAMAVGSMRRAALFMTVAANHLEKLAASAKTPPDLGKAAQLIGEALHDSLSAFKH